MCFKVLCTEKKSSLTQIVENMCLLKVMWLLGECGINILGPACCLGKTHANTNASYIVRTIMIYASLHNKLVKHCSRQ